MHVFIIHTFDVIEVE